MSKIQKKIFLIIFQLFAIIGLLYSQQSPIDSVKINTVTLKKITLGTLSGFELEKSIGIRTTLSFAGGYATTFLLDDNNYNLKGRFSVTPSVEAGFRLYYNLDKRNGIKKVPKKIVGIIYFLVQVFIFLIIVNTTQIG